MTNARTLPGFLTLQLLVDDEPLARRGIRSRLAKLPDVDVVDEASNAESGIRAILQHRPDVVFLDVEMPDADGFSVLQQLASEDRPLAVFVTALLTDRKTGPAQRILIRDRGRIVALEPATID